MNAATRVTAAPTRLVRLLGWLPPTLLSLGLLAGPVLPGGPAGPLGRWTLLAASATFFLLLLLRLVLVAVRRPGRRLGLVALATGIALWAFGSTLLTAEQAEGTVHFPSPGEVFYLASYVGMAAFLLLDASRGRSGPPSAVWLEAAVVLGAATSLSGLAVLGPLAHRFPDGGYALLLAVLYPTLDALLGLLVLAQVLLGQRSRSRSSLLLGLAFLMLTVADSTFVLSLGGTGSYSTNVVIDFLWGMSFAVLAAAACARADRVPTAAKPPSGRVLMLAAAVALAVLVVHPSGGIGHLVTVPAVVTMVCAGARMVVALRDARGKAEAMRLSLTDELTGLPNRRALLTGADGAIAAGRPFGLMLLDLDGFKDINDSIGHSAGDEVLTTIAGRLAAALPEGQVLARLGGDEFAVLAHTDDERALLEQAQALRATLARPVRVDGLELAVDASVGITVHEPDDVVASALLRRADIAMYEAKRTRAGALLFDRAQDGFSRARLQRGEELRTALAEGQLEAWYQPQVDARTGEAMAVEALVRWRHPTQGVLAPAAFLADARRAGLMTALSTVILEQVLADVTRWFAAGHRLRVSMNCAPTELLAGQFLPSVYRQLAAAALPAGTLLIEVTEDSFLSDPERARTILAELRDHGVETAIDDYGTGFSSLSYLRDLPVQELKLDRSFCSSALADERSRLIVRTTTQMAHALGLRLVAEGVEDAETAQLLVAAGADVLQGYHVARPMPAADVDGWLRARAVTVAALQPTSAR